MKRVIAIVLLFVVGTPVFTQEVLKLGTGEWAPLTGKGLPGGGPLKEVVVSAFAEAGIQVQVEFFPFKRAELLLEEGRLDGIFPYGRNEERSLKFVYGTQLFYSKAKFFYLRGAIEVPEFKSYGDLARFRIGGLRGSWFEPMFAGAGLTVAYVESDLQNLLKLVHGRVDIIPMAELVAWDLIARELPEYRTKIETFDFYPQGQSPQNISTRGVNLMMNRSNPKAAALLEKFNWGLSRIIQSGEYKNIFAKHFPAEALRDF